MENSNKSKYGSHLSVQDQFTGLPGTVVLKPKCNSRILVFLIAAFIFISLGVVFFILKDGGVKDRELAENPDIQKAAGSLQLPADSSAKIAEEKRSAYFIKSRDGKYSSVDVESNKEKELTPAGYTIVSPNAYGTAPDYFILQKDSDLFTLNLKDRTIRSIFDQSVDLKLKAGEEVSVKASITESDKFYIIITKYDPKVPDGPAGRLSLGSRAFFLDALTYELETARDVKLGGCYEYDSINERFFSYLCEEGIGSSIPLSVQDLNGGNTREIVSLQDYGAGDSTGWVSAKYSNGVFMTSEKNDLSKITVVYPSSSEIKKEVYTLNENVKAQIDKTYPYSEAIDKSTDTIVIGGDDFVLLLRFNSKKQIIESKYIPEKELYANFIFVNGGKLYYQAKDALRIVDLSTWEIEKSIPSDRKEVATLVFLAE